jgi:acetyl-CoA carboxylase biotin carboxylase subunit
MKDLGVPVVPGSDGAVTDDDEAWAIAERIGYPVLVKAAAGGGGRGMKVAWKREEMHDALNMARNEARNAFGSDAVYLERYLGHPRHIEVQVVGDNHGHAVHLGERDCSLQRRHQKLLEEGPSPALTDEQRRWIGERAVDAVRGMGYRSVGTFEFLFEDGEFFFIEMNTRLQVEHPVTEAITGVDLVREQIRVAAGLPLGFGQDDIEVRGHAIECRINAEDPRTFAPSPGQVTNYHAPSGLAVRVDSGLYSGYRIPPYYDSLVAKLIVSGTTRNECLRRLDRALEEFVIEGISTTIPLHAELIHEPDFISGNYDIHWLQRYVDAKGG